MGRGDNHKRRWTLSYSNPPSILMGFDSVSPMELVIILMIPATENIITIPNKPHNIWRFPSTAFSPVSLLETESIKTRRPHIKRRKARAKSPTTKGSMRASTKRLIKPLTSVSSSSTAKNETRNDKNGRNESWQVFHISPIICYVFSHANENSPGGLFSFQLDLIWKLIHSWDIEVSTRIGIHPNRSP